MLDGAVEGITYMFYPKVSSVFIKYSIYLNASLFTKKINLLTIPVTTGFAHKIGRSLMKLMLTVIFLRRTFQP